MIEHASLAEWGSLVVFCIWLALIATGVYAVEVSRNGQPGGLGRWYWGVFCCFGSLVPAVWAGDVLYYCASYLNADSPETAQCWHEFIFRYVVNYICPFVGSAMALIWAFSLSGYGQVFKKFFGLEPWFSYHRQKPHIQEAVNEVLALRANKFHNLCMLQESGAHLKNIEARDYAGLLKAEEEQAKGIQEAKEDFWKAHRVAKYFGFMMRESHKDYLNRPLASEADPVS